MRFLDSQKYYGASQTKWHVKVTHNQNYEGTRDTEKEIRAVKNFPSYPQGKLRQPFLEKGEQTPITFYAFHTGYNIRRFMVNKKI